MTTSPVPSPRRDPFGPYFTYRRASPAVPGQGSERYPVLPSVIARLFAFLYAYAEHGTIEHGLAAAGVTRRAFNYWCQRIPNFDRDFNELRAEHRDDFQDHVLERHKQKDPVALRFLLRLEQPERYGYNKHPLPTARWNKTLARRQRLQFEETAKPVLGAPGQGSRPGAQPTGERTTHLGSSSRFEESEKFPPTSDSALLIKFEESRKPVLDAPGQGSRPGAQPTSERITRLGSSPRFEEIEKFSAASIPPPTPSPRSSHGAGEGARG